MLNAGEAKEFDFDVVVVGAGIMGSCTAYHLAKRGQKVLLLEQFDLLHHRGSSHGESRTIRATYSEPYYPSMVMEAWRLWEEAEREVGFWVLTPTSHLDIAPADHKGLMAVVRTCSDAGITHQMLSPEEMDRRFNKVIKLPEGWTGVCSESGVIRATKAVSMFHTLARQHGAIIRDHVEVTAVDRNGTGGGGGGGGVRVGLAGGEWILGKKCVVTAGAWTKKLLNKLDITVPFQPLQTTICYWKIRDTGDVNEAQIFSADSNFPTFSSFGNPHIYGTPSLEFPGLLKVAVHGGSPCDPDRRTWCADSAVESLAPWIQRVLGDGVDHSAGPVLSQSCMYTMTPDEDFVIDYLGGEFGKDVVVAGGFSGHGFKMAPVIGRIVAELVTTGEATGPVELKHFSLKRFEHNGNGNAKEFHD